MCVDPEGPERVVEVEDEDLGQRQAVGEGARPRNGRRGHGGDRRRVRVRRAGAVAGHLGEQRDRRWADGAESEDGNERNTSRETKTMQVECVVEEIMPVGLNKYVIFRAQSSGLE